MKLRSVHSLLLMFLFGIILSISCKKDIKNDSIPVSPGDPFPIPAATPVSGSVSGMIVDENNIPVEGAVAKMGTLSTTTNAKGIFSFDHATLDKYITTVTVEMPGYFKAYRSFSANATRNYISIKLLPRAIAGNVSSTAGGTVSLLNGTSLSFQPNSVVIKSTGAAYSGNVKVYAAYIDPTASDIAATVPGSFMGRDENNLYTLQSTGMIAVDLEADNGEALQLASNLPATIKMPIPALLLDKAPSSINTWSLDEQGVWKKEGTAQKSGNFYEMQVTHFSFWNCDVPFNSIYLTIHVQDQNGNILPNTLVQLTIQNNNSSWGTSYGITDSLGNVSGFVPPALNLAIGIFSNLYSCSGPSYTQTIGPFATNSTLTITATVPTAQLYTISGTATDCTGSPIQNGTAIINAGVYGYYNTTILNGAYTVSVVSCSAITEVSVIAVNYANSLLGNSGLVSVSGNTITIPAISVCGTGTGATFAFQNNGGNCEGGFSGTYTLGTPLSANDNFSILVNVSAPGDYNITTSFVNGFSFSGAGTFTAIGQQLVTLIGTGTPTAGGFAIFAAQAGGITSCTFRVFVDAPGAILDPMSCSNVVVNGTYEEHTLLNATNTISLTMNVTSPGNYHLYSDYVNGISFVDSGYVASAGPHTFTLAGNGVPTNPPAGNFTIYANGTASNCQPTVNIVPYASFSFEGAPNACTIANVTGTFTAGTQIVPGQNTIDIQVNVSVAGPYYISTAVNNSTWFNASGHFSTTGPQMITLQASGTPTNAGTYTYTPFDVYNQGVAGCTFTVQVN
ncbi:MAG: carboxypeptidase-like regulatory domain-containing protein [Ferruginibacter sp.]